MRERTWGMLGGSLGAILLALGAAATAWADPPRNDVQIVVGGPDGPVTVGHTPMKLGDYWIGLECFPVQPALRAQLGLADNQGLLVEAVMPGSPAAKAGVKQYDVLLKAGDKKLSDMKTLVEAIEAAKDKPLKLELFRAGKSITVDVTPAKRPAEAGPGAMPGGASGAGPVDVDQLRRWIDRLRAGEAGEGPMRFRFFHPGAILPPGATVPGAMPANLSISITRSGNEPAKIVVKRDQEKWEVTVKELDKLPADVRPYVEQMLGPGLRAQAFDLVPEILGGVGLAPEARAAVRAGAESRVEKRLESLEHRMDQMRATIDELRASRGGAKEKERQPGKELPAPHAK